MELPLRIALVIFTLVYFFIILKAVKHKKMQISLSIFWLLTGVILIVALLIPNLVQTISSILGFGLTVNMIFCIAIFLAFYLIFTITILLSKESRKNILLIQEISLLKKEIEDIKSREERKEK